MTLAQGMQLGPYEILAPIGAGGMGEVYRARDKRLEREVAIKVLPEQMSKDSDALSRFEREAKILAALSHQNILTVFDVGSEAGSWYVVTEFLTGETLHEKIQRSAIPWEEVLEIAIPIAEALVAAHSKSVIHRDLKPQNIFLTASGVVKILDFGLARIESNPEVGVMSQAYTLVNTSPGLLIGTVQYMSPEQVKGLQADARSDLFSFGCMLYEALTGKRPFSGIGLAELLAAILRDPVPELSGVVHPIPPSLEQVVRTCLQKNPDDRIQTARELLVALKAVASGSAEWASPLPATKKVRKKAIDSIAVLPFWDRNANSETEYLLDGLTDMIIDTLSRFPKLRIMSRSSVFRYKGRNVDASKVGRELNVRAVLTGEVENRGTTTVIRAELVDVLDGARIWGDQYTCDVCDFADFLERMAGEISDQLKIKVLQKVRKQLQKRPTHNAEAYRLYLQGRFFWNKRTRDGMIKSIDFFEQSIQEDPKFAPAYAGLSDAYSLLGGFGYVSASEAYSKAKMEAIHALELDPTLAEAHCSLATVKYRFDWDWEAAEKHFKLSLQYSPGYATARHWYGVYLILLGRFDEGFAQVERSLELDPFSLVVNWTRGYVLYYMRKHDEAIQQYRKTLGIDPTFARVHIDIGLAYLQKSMFREGIEEIQKGMNLLEQSPGLLASLGYAYGLAGDREEATKILEELQVLAKRQYLSPYALAVVYIGLGDFDQAFFWLDKAFEQREDAVVSIPVNPRMDPIRSDPRYQELLKRLNFPIKNK